VSALVKYSKLLGPNWIKVPCEIPPIWGAIYLLKPLVPLDRFMLQMKGGEVYL